MDRAFIKRAAQLVVACAAVLPVFAAASAEDQVYHKGTPWDVVLTAPGGSEAPYCAVTSTTWASRSISIELTLTGIDKTEFFVRLQKDRWNLPIGRETTVTVGSFPPGATMMAKAIDSDHLYARLPAAPSNDMDGNAMNLLMSLKTVWATRDAMQLIVQFPGNEQPWIVPAIESFEAYQFNDAFKQCRIALTKLGPSIYHGSDNDSATSPFDQSESNEGQTSSEGPGAASSASSVSNAWTFTVGEEDWGETCVAKTQLGGVTVGFMASPGKGFVGFVEGAFDGDVTALWRVDDKISRVSAGSQSHYFGWHQFGELTDDLLTAVANGQQLTIDAFNNKRVVVGLQGAPQAISAFRQCAGKGDKAP